MLPEIEIDYLTEDEDERELCRCYWLLNTEEQELFDAKEKFRYTLSELALNFRLKPRQIHNKVAQYSRAYIKKSKCDLCGIPTHFLNRRNDFYSNRKVYEYQPWENPVPYLCESCKGALEKRQAKKAKTKNSLQFSGKIKSIFPTSQHLQFFKQLRREEHFVYPQIAISVFLEEQNFEEFENLENEIISFLVCDGKGNPQKAIDFVVVGKAKELTEEQKEIFYQKESFFEQIGLEYKIEFS
ncbi:hypothetical protein [Bernardetia sp.]|uniref:hypothetical protein n=1 Tax=Bernardetia sp. TaxID=1937974 RepID=UPI0025BAE242|nr:hypothetical protein [Bernardetia sp.]